MHAPRDPAVASRRGSVARLAQSLSDDHPRLIEARKALAYAKLAAQAARVVATWPEPTEEQRNAVTQLLQGCNQ